MGLIRPIPCHNRVMPNTQREDFLRFLIFLGYVISLSIATWWISGTEFLITELEFGFGPEIDRILSGQEMHVAARMPVVPYLLVTLSLGINGHLALLIAKNLLVQSLLFIVLRSWWQIRELRNVSSVLFLYLLLFPQLGRHGFTLIPEEGYLIALVAFLFHGVIKAPEFQKLLDFLPYALGCAIAFLTKGSMLLLAPLFCLLFFLRTRNTKVLILFVATVGTAMSLWGAVNLEKTGRFAVTTVYTGYEMWKGNNPQTLDVYPENTLDRLSNKVPQILEGEDPWEWSRRLQSEVYTYWIEHPLVTAKLFAVRFYKTFLAVTAVASGDSPRLEVGQARDLLKTVGVVFMIAFRCLLWLAILHAVWTLYRTQTSGEIRTSAICYLCFIVGFSAPFLIAFSYERQLMPMVVPTVIYLLHMLSHERVFQNIHSPNTGLKSSMS